MTADLKKWYRLSYLCVHCRSCTVANYHKLGKFVPICPSGTWGGFESYYSLGWTEIARNLIEGKIKTPTKALLDIVYTCTSCAACSANCKENTSYGIESGKTIWLMEELRTHLADLGWGPLPKHASFGKSIEKNHNPYQESHNERFAWLKGKAPQKAETMYFTGCTASYRQKSIAESTVKILKSLGIDFGILGKDEWCCGSPLIRTGQRKLALEVAKHNVDAIKDSGANRVVTSCAGCYMTLKEDYERLFGLKLGFEVLHTSELLSSLLKEGKLKFTKELNMAITYHDPCHLGRSRAILLPDLEKSKAYEPPREVLRAIPGIKLVEMLRNRDDAWCCGSGGGVKSAYPEMAIWAATERLKEVEEVGVQNLVSSCPFCKRNLQDGAEASNKPIKVFDVTELVAQAL
jgi:heterodisulfide reductase subunit D